MCTDGHNWRHLAVWLCRQRHGAVPQPWCQALKVRLFNSLTAFQAGFVRETKAPTGSCFQELLCAVPGRFAPIFAPSLRLRPDEGRGGRKWPTPFPVPRLRTITSIRRLRGPNCWRIRLPCGWLRRLRSLPKHWCSA